ncbi:hypothetical protein [Streptomyces sp. DHE17-7]|uniref:hypothetical protein n=1 Tax=Streptomyces sp. DHE17-7 TaxID=2759949 RepID=UPI0022EB513C|nr:hypothetical protein [Streptomyces sp. DHE17-7]MBJ6622735.1 hypothetical protein [Streptomyces sp. DHE17-7]
MSMETTAWTQLHSVMNAEQDRRPLARATLRVVCAFARRTAPVSCRFVLARRGEPPSRRSANPRLRGRVFGPIVSGGDEGTVVRLALLIALIAVAEAALGILSRRLSAMLEGAGE